MTRVQRIGLIGAGGAGERHLVGLKALGRTELVGVASGSIESASRITDTWGGVPYRDASRMLDGAGPDAVWVCVPPYASCAVCLLLAACAAPPPTARVLFIGNSYTYVNGGVDRQLAGLAPTIATRQLAISGYTLERHWTDGQDVQRNLEIIRLRNASSISEGTKKHGLGWFDMDILRRAEKTYVELGLLKKSVDVDAIFTNRFVQEL